MERDLSTSTWGKTLKVYMILTGCAVRRETATHRIIAERIGVIAQGVNVYLARIHRYCVRNNLPPLDVLVVSVLTGEVEGGYSGPREYIYRDRERVYDFDWFMVSPSTNWLNSENRVGLKFRRIGDASQLLSIGPSAPAASLNVRCPLGLRPMASRCCPGYKAINGAGVDQEATIPGTVGFSRIA